MPEDNRDDLNRDKNMGAGKQGDSGQGQNPGQRAPGRDLEEDDDRSTGGRQGGSQGKGREDRESDMPGGDQPKPQR